MRGVSKDFGRPWDLIAEPVREIDVSGGRPLDKRPALKAAVEAVEDGAADVVMVSYLARLCRNRRVQDEVRDRIQDAGGQLISLELGEITNTTATMRFAHGVVGDINELYIEQIREVSAKGQKSAVAAGHWIGPVPPGYIRGEDKVLVVDEVLAPAVREAFEMRANGSNPKVIHAFLAEHGIRRTVSGVRAMLKSRCYRGEIVYGDLHNARAHEAIVDAETFGRVQRRRGTGGRLGKSDRLLARLGVLKCATCDGRMSASTANTSRPTPYQIYRCTSEACDHPVTIGAEIVEDLVEETMRQILVNRIGASSAADEYGAAVAALDPARETRAALVEILDPFEPADRDRLALATAAVADAQVEVDRLRGLVSAAEISLGKDWDELTFDERRANIALWVESVKVVPGRGTGRIQINARP